MGRRPPLLPTTGSEDRRRQCGGSRCMDQRVPRSMRSSVRDLLSQTSWLRALARRLVDNVDTADDLVQETWLAAVSNPPERGRPPPSVAGEGPDQRLAEPAAIRRPPRGPGTRLRARRSAPLLRRGAGSGGATAQPRSTRRRPRRAASQHRTPALLRGAQRRRDRPQERGSGCDRACANLPLPASASREAARRPCGRGRSRLAPARSAPLGGRDVPLHGLDRYGTHGRETLAETDHCGRRRRDPRGLWLARVDFGPPCVRTRARARRALETAYASPRTSRVSGRMRSARRVRPSLRLRRLPIHRSRPRRGGHSIASRRSGRGLSIREVPPCRQCGCPPFTTKSSRSPRATRAVS